MVVLQIKMDAPTPLSVGCTAHSQTFRLYSLGLATRRIAPGLD